MAGVTVSTYLSEALAISARNEQWENERLVVYYSRHVPRKAVSGTVTHTGPTYMCIPSALHGLSIWSLYLSQLSVTFFPREDQIIYSPGPSPSTGSSSDFRLRTGFTLPHLQYFLP
jgi:hypothetical protein